MSLLFSVQSLNQPVFDTLPCHIRQAAQHNEQVQNRYGDTLFHVTHDNGIISEWWACGRSHLDMLLRIEINLGYIKTIDSIKQV